MALEALKAEAALEFVRGLALPAFLGDEENNIYLANQAMVEAFGYDSLDALEERLRQPTFLAAHFPPDAIAQLFEMLYSQGLVKGWLMRGLSLDGRELNFEVHVRAKLRSAQGPAYFLEALFVTPGGLRDAEAFLAKARKEAELATRAKTEFLSNISHELRTPLNIIVGMLGLAVDDPSINEDLRCDLSLAKEAADGLFLMLNDLIILSNLEARRLTSDISPFSPDLLLQALAHQFAARAGEKNIRLAVESGGGGGIVEGGYNLILIALDKLVDNAIKFSEPGSEVKIYAAIEERPDGPWLLARVTDQGPGFPPGILESDELMVQGDGSKTRRYGGLGLGLSITNNIMGSLGGRLSHARPEGGGAEMSLSLPVKHSEMEI